MNSRSTAASPSEEEFYLRQIDEILREIKAVQQQHRETKAERARYHKEFRRDMDQLWALMGRVKKAR